MNKGTYIQKPLKKRIIVLIKYICKHCNSLETETSTCPVCGQRTDLLKSDIFYCDTCNAPSYTEECTICHSHCKRIGSDLRPVFAQERLLLEVALNKPMEYAGKAVWSTSTNTYWIDGKQLRINTTDLKKLNPTTIVKTLNEYEEQNKPFIENDIAKFPL